MENTHEAIIPMEVYQAVQTEKARRRELGGFGKLEASIPPALPAKSSAVGAERAISVPTARGAKTQTPLYDLDLWDSKKDRERALVEIRISREPMLKEACACGFGTRYV